MGNNLAVALITDLISELNVEDSKKKQFFKKAKGALSKGLEYVNLDFGILNGEKLTEKFQDLIIGFGERTDDIKHLKENLQDIINDAIKENKSDRIVIFIDDLDRLVPEKAIELLEVLKLFLDCEHCVFVLAIDYNVVVRGAKSKYGKDLDDEKGKAFFEKIIQVPFTVPVANYDLQNFIESSLNKLDFCFDKNNEERNQLETITQLIRYSIGNNPRSINRLFNSVSLLMYINNGDKVDHDEKLMILAMVCFQLRFEEAYNYLLTAYNNSPEDSDEIESYLIDLLENSFELLDDEVDYNSLVSLLGKFTFKDKKDRDDFTNFYISLKKLLGYNEQKLTVEHFNKLIEQMTFSNAVSIGNTDTITAEKKKQTHVPNRNVQLIIRKLFNKLAGVKNHFDITNPELFGTESNEQRNMPLAKEYIKEENIFDRIRLTGSKGQGIYIFSSSDPSNTIYLSGDTHGRLFNDGLQLIIDGKQIKKVKINYSADELANNADMYEEFGKTFFKHYYKLVEIAKEHLRE